MTLKVLEYARVLNWMLQINFSQFKNMQELKIQYPGMQKKDGKEGGRCSKDDFNPSTEG
jgi:hypothetical protein